MDKTIKQIHSIKRNKVTSWDILDKFISRFPPIAATILFIVAVVIFIIGFSRHGINFVKYGFKQMILDSSLEKRFDDLYAKFDTRFSNLENRIKAIETNHFGHLKNYLGILNGIMLDKNIIVDENLALLYDKNWHNALR
jgi:hypothetical protein